MNKTDAGVACGAYVDEKDDVHILIWDLSADVRREVTRTGRRTDSSPHGYARIPEDLGRFIPGPNTVTTLVSSSPEPGDAADALWWPLGDGSHTQHSGSVGRSPIARVLSPVDALALLFAHTQPQDANDELVVAHVGTRHVQVGIYTIGDGVAEAYYLGMSELRAPGVFEHRLAELLEEGARRSGLKLASGSAMARISAEDPQWLAGLRGGLAPLVGDGQIVECGRGDILLGAGLQARIMLDDTTHLLLIAASALEYGVVDCDGVHRVLVYRDTTVPTSRTEVFNVKDVADRSHGLLAYYSSPTNPARKHLVHLPTEQIGAFPGGAATEIEVTVYIDAGRRARIALRAKSGNFYGSPQTFDLHELVANYER